MGFFSKLWKGIKKTFKKIFKPIKKVFKSIGKFMGKIGIVGQIAMSFILPGIGSALSGAFSNVVGGLMKGALGPAGKAAGWVLGKAGEFAQMASKGFKTVTGAVTDFIGTTGKYVGGKLGITKEMTLKQAFGSEGWGGRLTDSFSKLGDSASEFFDTDVKGVLPDPARLGPSTLKNQQQSPIQEYQMEIESQLDLSKPLAPVDDPLAASSVSSYTIGPNEEMLNPRFDNLVSEKSLLGKKVSTTVTPSTVTEAAAQEQSMFSKGLEMLTGEKTLGGAGQKLVGKTGEYIMDAPGKTISGAVQTAGLQGLGLAAKPPGDPGVPFGSQPFQQYYGGNSMAFQQARTEMFDMFSPYQNYVAAAPSMGDAQGSWLGPNFWQRELQSRVA